MSLINKMLQDLEERKSGADMPGNWQGQVRAAPEPRPRGINRAVVVGLICTVAAGAGGAAWWLNKSGSAAVEVAPQPAVQAFPYLSLKLEHLPPSVPEASTNQDSGPALADRPAETGLSSPAPATDGNAALPEDMSADPVPFASSRAPGQATPVLERSKAEMPDKVDRSASASALASSTQPNPDARTVQPALPVNSSAKTVPATKAKAFAPEPVGSVEETFMPVKVSKQVKELTPAQRAENEYRRALTLIEQGRSKEAAGILEQALHLDARHAAARQMLAALLIDGKRPDEAMRVLNEGLNVDRSQAGLAMMLARMQIDKQDARTAIQTLQSSLPYSSERADYRAFMAALLQREARHKEAIDHYLAALRKTPGNGVWWMGMGISLQAESRLPEAHDAFSRAKLSGTLSPELLAFVEQKLAQLR